MKRKLYYFMTLVLCMGLMLITTGCGGSGKSSYDYKYSKQMVGNAMEVSMDSEMPKEESAQGSDFSSGKFELPSNEQFIVRTRLSVETKEFDESVKKIEALASELKGYIESVEASYGTTYDRNRNRSVFYMLRIPKGSSATAVNTIKSEVGLVVDEQMSTENVTKRIRDTKRDIELLKAKEDRLIELSKKTEDIEALIHIETELAEIISNREYSQAALQNLEYDVQYDFLSINLREVRETKVIEEDNFLGDVKTAFRDSIDGMVDFFQGLVIFLVRSWFALLIMALIIIIVIWLIKRISKRAAKKRLERMNAYPPVYPMNYAAPNMGVNQPQPEKPENEKPESEKTE